MSMNLKLDSPSADRTFEIGAGLGARLRGQELILISGNLGAGKTLITKGIASSLGIDPREVVSPTFTLMNQFEYTPPTGSQNSPCYFLHFDCYRFVEQSDGETGLIFPEIDEWIDEAIIVVEWAQYLNSSYFSLPNSIRINIKILTPLTRLITIESALNYR